MRRTDGLILAIGVSATVILIALAALIPGLDMQTRVNIAGTAGPILSISVAWSVRQFMKRDRDGGTAK